MTNNIRILFALSALLVASCSPDGPPRTLSSIAVTPSQVSIADGTNTSLTAIGTFSDGTTEELTATAAWSSSDSSVVTVNNGSATGMSVGTATITAGDIGSGVSGSMMLDVTAAVLVSIELTPTHPSIALGTAQAFIATGIYTDSTTADLTSVVTLQASDPSIASCTVGSAQSLSIGSTTLSALHAPSSISGSATLTVTAAELTSLAVTPTNPSIALGTSETLTAMGTFSDASTQDLSASVTWSSSDAAVTTVSNAPGTAGQATSVAVGSATISALDGSSGLAGSTLLTVTPAMLISLAITPTSPSIALGTGETFTAVGTFSDLTTQDLTTLVTWSSSAVAVATVSNALGSQGVATSVSVGSTTITALDVATGITAATAFTVTNAVLVSIDVTPQNTSIALGTTETYTAIGTFSDLSTQDLTTTVTWSSSDALVCVVSNAAPDHGTATSVATGPATITAVDPGSGASASTTLTVTPAVLVSIAIAPDPVSIALGTSTSSTATGTFSDGSTQDLTTAVTWSSSDIAVATVSNAPGTEGLITSVSIGSAAVTATDPGSSIFGASNVTISPAVLTSLAIAPVNPSLALGHTQAFTATGTFSDGSTQDLTAAVTWISSDDNVATVSNAPGSHGLATSVSVASATITAIDPSTSVSDSTTITITPAVPAYLDISPDSPALYAGSSLQLAATLYFSDGSTQDLTSSVGWSSSDTLVADVNTGFVNGFSAGTSTISIADAGTGFGDSTTLTVVVPPSLMSISISPTDPTIAHGGSLQFAAIGFYSDGSTQDLTGSVTWTSSDPAIADVTGGFVNGLWTGVATITADDSGSGFNASTLLTVAATLTSLSISPTDPTITQGNSIQFTATGNYSDGSTQDLTGSVGWSSSDGFVADVNGGFSNAFSSGSATISAQDAGSGFGASTTLYVNAPPTLNSITLSPTDPTIAQGSSIQFTATGNYSDGSTADLTGSVSWSSWNTWIADVSNGNATGFSTGWTMITAYDSSSGLGAATSLTIDPPPSLTSISLSPTDPTITQGSAIQFAATGHYSDGSTQDITSSVSWGSSDTFVGDVSNGYATAFNAGTTTIGIYESGSGYSASTTLTVQSAVVLNSISLSPTDPTITQGDALQFTAIGNYSDGSTADITSSVSWSSSDTFVADVSNGYATGYNPGTVTINVYDSGSGQSASTTLTVQAPVVLTSISLSPVDPTINAGDTLQFTATGNYSDGSTQDITSSVSWGSSDTGVADVTSGLATSFGPGSVTISATDGGTGISTSTSLTVL